MVIDRKFAVAVRTETKRELHEKMLPLKLVFSLLFIAVTITVYLIQIYRTKLIKMSHHCHPYHSYIIWFGA